MTHTDISLDGTYVRDERSARGWSRRHLAELTGLSEGKIWRIENKSTMSDQERVALREVFFGAATDVVQSSATTREPVLAGIPADPPVLLLTEELEVTWLDDDLGSGSVGLTFLADDREMNVWDALQSTVTPRMMTALDGRRRWSNSELQSAKECPRRWWLGWYRGLRPKIESPIGPRAVGDRVHRALKAWYVPDGRQRTDPRDALERLIVEDWSALVNERPDGVDAETSRRFTQDANLERAMVAGYLDWLAETGEDAELKIVASETYVEAALPELPNALLVGRLDVRVRRVTDDVRLFIDHKTVGDLVRPKRTLHLNEQMLFYHLLEELNPDDEQRCDGALYNMLKRVKRTAAARPPFFGRVEVPHNRHEIASFRRRTVSTVNRVAEMERRLDEGEHHLDVCPPTPTPNCDWKCQFFAVCGMFDDGSRVEHLLDEHYTVGDPTSYYALPEEVPAT